MRKSTLGRIGCIVGGFGLMLLAAHDVYMGIWGNNIKQDELARENSAYIGEMV